MGFKDVKGKILQCLRSGSYDHEARRNIDVKNLFACGQVSEAEVIRLVSKTTGNQYEDRPHDFDSSVRVHIFKPRHEGTSWYIKFYFVEPDAVFISVHT